MIDMHIFRGLLENWKMIVSLAVTDFKTKYAGTQFGFLWAFVQPVITVFVYLFAFQVIAKANPIEGGFPFVLWLIAGMVPWFFFSEAVMNGTTSLADYSYLVKKVVFKIYVLPAVRVLSAAFVHMFFIVFTLLVYVVMGKYPALHILQIIYYMACIVALSTACSYITASIMPFFKDFMQVVNVMLMIGMWACPVMWDYKTIVAPQYHWIIKLNPVFYIVQGYRDAFIDKIWFWERPVIMLYFWLGVAVLWWLGTWMFRRLSVHFSDVL